MSRHSQDDRQVNLFGAAPAPADSRTVGPAQLSVEHERIADRLPATLRFGTSSWSFPGWEGLVYDREASKAHLAKKGLAAYARHPLLRAVGVDRTFYAPLPAAAFAEYAAMVPDSFRFLVKASSLCTSPYERDGSGRLSATNPLFLAPEFATNEVVAPFVEGLGAKAGPLVFQFSPVGRRIRAAPQRFAEKLARFLAELPAGPLYAVELRDAELFSEDYFQALAAGGAQHCLSVHPRVPSISEQRRLSGNACDGPLVVRWMLQPGLGYEEAKERYDPFTDLVDEDPANRAAVADLCLEHARAGKEVVVIANNKAEGSAPMSVFKLAQRIVDRIGAAR